VYILERGEDSASGAGSSDDSAATGAPALRKVRQQIVQLGDRRGDFVAVLKGVQAGDEVVTLGTFKLQPDSMVIVRGDQQVPASLNPEVKDS
jgi:membrane fusion protein (multidrug efflux system)